MPNPTLTTKAFSADVSVVDGERAVKAVISTSAVDRDGEVLIPQGCNWKDFQANPVVMLGHAYYTLPVGKIVGLTRDATSITAKVVFAERPSTHPPEEEWAPDTLLSLYQQKVMNAFSVGFTITEARPATDRDVTNFGAGCRRVISKWKLMELSFVPIPCNQEAVALAVSKGIVSPAMAKGVWGVEAKADEPKMGTCAECGKEFALDDMTEDDGEMVCKGCAAGKAAPVKHVVQSVTIPAAAGPTIEPKRVVYFVPPSAPGKRRSRRKRSRPLRRAKRGADQAFKEFKLVTLYDESCGYRVASVTRSQAATRLTASMVDNSGLGPAPIS
jgi:hypothetical protein